MSRSLTKWRPRFSIASLILLTAITGLLIESWRDSRDLRHLRREAEMTRRANKTLLRKVAGYEEQLADLQIQLAVGPGYLGKRPSGP